MKRPDRLPIGVLESAWFEGSHCSVKPLFEVLSTIYAGRADAYLYERFVGKASFDEAHSFISTRKSVRYLYIASHGKDDATGIACPNGDRISTTELRNDLVRASGKPDGRIDGICYAACHFANEENAGRILREVSNLGRNLWVSGYSTAADWGSSSALDLLFWDCYLHYTLTEGQKPRDAIRTTASYLIENADGLASRLQFGVWVMEKGGVRNLLAP